MPEHTEREPAGAKDWNDALRATQERAQAQEEARTPALTTACHSTRWMATPTRTINPNRRPSLTVSISAPSRDT